MNCLITILAHLSLFNDPPHNVKRENGGSDNFAPKISSYEKNLEGDEEYHLRDKT